MSLCPPARCNCTITSSSLQVTGKPGGVGYNLETYEAVATESPDTRPGPGVRFEGMRVWTTDTKRLFVWNATASTWVLLSEPPQPVVAADFVIRQGTTVISKTVEYSRSQRHHGTFNWRGRVMLTSAGVADTIQVTFPTALTADSTLAYEGTAWIYDGSTGEYHIGLAVGNSPTQFIINVTKGNGPTHFGHLVPIANGDVLMWHIWGVLD